MKASKFTDAQKAFIIRQGEDGATVEEICSIVELQQQSKSDKYAAQVCKVTFEFGGEPTRDI